MSGDLRFIFIDVGHDHSCGMTVEGLVYCWGSGEDGQLGNGMTTDQSVPVPVESPFG